MSYRPAVSPPASGPLAVLELDVSELGSRPDALHEIFDRGLLAVIVRNVFPGDLMAAAVDRIGRGEVSVPEVHVPVFAGPIYGRPLVTASRDLAEYLDDAALFREGCASIFGSPSVDARIQGVFAALSGGRPASVPCGDDGRPFTAATMRVLLEGDRLPLHTENTTFDHDVMKRLNPSLDRTTLMSYYAPMAVPGGGGELRIYDVESTGEGSGIIHRMSGEEAARAYFASRWSTVLRPGVGDMLLFDGGRHYHEVTPVVGRPRWTMGGFFAFSADHRALHFWS